MRRLLVLLLLVLLPLQSSWSALASYCEHETRLESAHLGHHEHLHADGRAAKAADATADDQAPGAPDLDCGICHGAGTGMPPLASALPDERTAAPRPRAIADATAAGQAPARPERPQWAPPA